MRSVRVCDLVRGAQVEAEAITDSQPRAGFTPRRGQGFPLLGKSATYPPAARVRLPVPALLVHHLHDPGSAASEVCVSSILSVPAMG